MQTQTNFICFKCICIYFKIKDNIVLPVVVWLKYENNIYAIQSHSAMCHTCKPNRKYTKKNQFNHLHNEIMYTLNDGNVFIAVVVVVVVVIVARTTQCVRATSKNKQYKIIITAVFFLRNYGNLLLVNAELKKSVYIYTHVHSMHTQT